MSNQKYPRFFGPKRPQQADIAPDNTFLLVDSNAFKRPNVITVETLGNVLKLKINENLDSKNVSTVQFMGLYKDVSANPNKMPISPQLHLSVDENYLYVWVPQIGRWKRMLLSSWVSEVGDKDPGQADLLP